MILQRDGGGRDQDVLGHVSAGNPGGAGHMVLAVKQQIVSIDTFGVAKYSTASVGTTLSFALVCRVAGRPTA